ncbi:ErpG protein (plasmid) [Borreliella afzelii PKo]|uniref:ErpG protein n=1 Tax=Borreliella afzelii (strain PKo) TaxID=390236 RepID=G0IT37_BORAP|nr:ErpG protein [Borreliella afzelii PKo]
MNKKMKMFIICAVFALISSCKNYAISKDSEKNLKGFLDKELMRGDDPNNSLFNPPPILPSSRHDNTLVLKAAQAQSGGQKEDKVKAETGEDNKEKEEIEKQIKELKDKIEKSDKKTPIETYLEYEGEIKKIREELEEKLKDKKEEKEKLEKELKELEDSLKKKKDERKKALEEAKKKFEEFKGQVDSTTGETSGEQVKGQGQIGGQAWRKAQELGLSANYSSSAGTSDMTKGIIDDAIKKIEEELKKLLEDKKE